MKRSILVEQLREELDYSPQTGEFRWKKADKMGPRLAGKIAGGVTSLGYWKIRVCGELYVAHRLAWLHVHGRWPAQQLDHINGDRADNRIENLRECSPGENSQNRAKSKNNTSGFNGVSWSSATNNWRARIRINRKLLELGGYSTPEEAYSKYLEVKAQVHKFQPSPRCA